MKENKYQIRTDLAIEAKDMYVENEQQTKKEVPGVHVEDKVEDDIRISQVTINQEGAEKINKKAGQYITIYADGVKKQDTEKQDKASQVLAKELETLIREKQIKKDSKALIVGLGNWHVTPDALGPMTLEKLLVTNHLFELEYETVADGYRPVAAISPGVMGVTGMETSDIILGIVKKFKPDFVIAIDALASRSIERVNETIQLSDSGIHPGSGVGNKRKELSEQTLGVPVIAIGVPTVVDAVTIASDTMDYLLKHFGREWREKNRPAKSLKPIHFPFGQKKLTADDLPDEKERQTFLGLIGNLSENEKRGLIEEVLTPIGQNLIVTPKDIDGYMIDMSHLIAKGINAALHTNIAEQKAGDFTR